MQSQRLDFVAILALVGALFACKSLLDDDSCSSDADCKNGFTCQGSTCVAGALPAPVATAAAAPAAAGGGTCAKAVACCNVVNAKNPASAGAACEQFAAMPESACASALNGFDQAARALGTSCEGGGTVVPKTGGTPAPVAAADDTSAGAGADDDGPVPLVPTTKSNPPTIAEWKAGREVNTQGPNSHPDDCTMKVVREWLKVDCFGDVLGYENMEKFGRKNVDYFEHFKQGKLGSFVLRLKKGQTQKVRICRIKNRASLFVNWPGAKDRPIHIALGKGPACENPTM